MRNLIQYPITLGETCTALQNAQVDYLKKKIIGGTEGIALLHAEMFIRDYKSEFEQFVNRQKGK